jgi:hypothetical protein
VPNWTVSPSAFVAIFLEMRVGDLTGKGLLSVPCPDCGVAAEHRCLLRTGGLRAEPRSSRRLSAGEAMDRFYRAVVVLVFFVVEMRDIGSDSFAEGRKP